MDNNIVFVSGNTAKTNSIRVAEYFEKEHKRVLRSIQNLIKMDNQAATNFGLCDYEAKNGEGISRTYPMYEMNRDGFMLLAMGFTGAKALKFKMDFIKAFNELEAKLKEGKINQPVKYDIETILETALTKIKEQRELIDQQKPAVEFTETVARAVNAVTIREFAKNLGSGEKRFFSWLKDNGYLMWNNQPYQEFVDRDYFRVVQKTYKSRGEAYTYYQTLVTGKGQVALQKAYSDKKQLTHA